MSDLSEVVGCEKGREIARVLFMRLFARPVTSAPLICHASVCCIYAKAIRSLAGQGNQMSNVAFRHDE